MIRIPGILGCHFGFDEVYSILTHQNFPTSNVANLASVQLDKLVLRTVSKFRCVSQEVDSNSFLTILVKNYAMETMYL